MKQKIINELRDKLSQDEKAKSDLAKEKSVAESALAKAESALAKANLEIVSLKTKPGRSPADAQLPHGYTY